MNKVKAEKKKKKIVKTVIITVTVPKVKSQI